MPPPISVALIAHGERGGARSNAVLAGHAGALDGDEFAAGHGVLNGDPSLEDCMRELQARTGGTGPILVYPFFMSAGYFVRTVMVRRLNEAGIADRCMILTWIWSSRRPGPPLTALACGPARRVW